jgi:hypothetical protein
MEETNSNPTFEQVRLESQKDAELLYYRTCDEYRNNGEETLTPIQYVITEDIIALLQSVFQDVRQSVKPEDTFLKALKNLDKVEQKRIVLENLLEGIKRGEKPSVLLKRFDELGLIDISQNRRKVETPPTGDEERWLGATIGKLKKKLFRLGLTLTNLARSAAENLPKKLKFGASVDFFPPNFGLKIDADTSLQDIIDWIDQAWFDSGIQSG